MEFYKDALSGELEIMLYKDAPPMEGMDVPPGHGDKVMHARTSFGNAYIMAADCFPGSETTLGNGIHIMLDSKDPDTAERYFNNLLKGGKVTMPFGETFWVARFGQFTDKFGLNWMLNCDKEN